MFSGNSKRRNSVPKREKRPTTWHTTLNDFLRFKPKVVNIEVKKEAKLSRDSSLMTKVKSIRDFEELVYFDDGRKNGLIEENEDSDYSMTEEDMASTQEQVESCNGNITPYLSNGFIIDAKGDRNIKHNNNNISHHQIAIPNSAETAKLENELRPTIIDCKKKDTPIGSNGITLDQNKIQINQDVSSSNYSTTTQENESGSKGAIKKHANKQNHKASIAQNDTNATDDCIKRVQETRIRAEQAMKEYDKLFQKEPSTITEGEVVDSFGNELDPVIRDDMQAISDIEKVRRSAFDAMMDYDEAFEEMEAEINKNSYVPSYIENMDTHKESNHVKDIHIQVKVQNGRESSVKNLIIQSGMLNDDDIININISKEKSQQTIINSSIENVNRFGKIYSNTNFLNDLLKEEKPNIFQKMVRKISLRKDVTLEQENLRKKLIEKDCIIRELIDTEKAYIESLECIVKEYITCFTKIETLKSLGENIRAMFRIIVNISNDSKAFLEDLISVSTEHNYIGKAFLRHKRLFERYPEYCKSKSSCMDVLPPEVNAVILKKDSELKDRLGLNSRLLHPVQRIAKYELLLKGLLKCLIRENIPAPDVLEALTMIENIAQTSNTLTALYSIKTKTFSIEETGYYVRSYNFLSVFPKGKKIFIFVFQKRIILMEEDAKHKNTFKYQDDMVMENMSTDFTLPGQTFKIFYRHNKFEYVFKAHDAAAKIKFKTDMDALIPAVVEREQNQFSLRDKVIKKSTRKNK